MTYSHVIFQPNYSLEFHLITIRHVIFQPNYSLEFHLITIHNEYSLLQSLHLALFLPTFSKNLNRM